MNSWSNSSINLEMQPCFGTKHLWWLSITKSNGAVLGNKHQLDMLDSVSKISKSESNSLLILRDNTQFKRSSDKTLLAVSMST